MKVWRLSELSYALERNGNGAKKYGGRWNSIGTEIIYTGSSISLVSFEKLVNSMKRRPVDLVLIEINLPDDQSLYQHWQDLEIPNDWNSPLKSDKAKKIGDEFILANSHLGLFVPSAVIIEEDNILINPHHPEFKNVTLTIVRKFDYDNRLFEHLSLK